MSNVIQIQQLLVGKVFHIPPYQRDYSWTTEQIQDLLEDIQEAMESGSSHYLGTVVLAGEGASAFEIVDGQQRMTTLVLVIHALLQELDQNDRDRIADEAILLRHGQNLNLDLGTNAAFVDALFSGNDPTPQSAGQRRLREGYSYARERAKALRSSGAEPLIKKWLATIKSLELIQFLSLDTGRAIRMFQTVNDRGLPLTAMDKAKALLVYYSSRFLSGDLDKKISVCFGEAFAAFDFVRELVRMPGFRVDNIVRESFSEDDLLRYHYLAYQHPLAVGAGDYEGSVRTVYDGFLKGTLKLLSTDATKLKTFIDDYVTDLQDFALAFKRVIADIKSDSRLYKLFVVLGLAARLYPLTIRMYQRNLLTAPMPGANPDLLHCIEVTDVRIYKTRRTDPAKDIGNLSHRSRHASTADIATTLKNFILQFQSDAVFQSNMTRDIWSNQAVPLILLAQDEQTLGSPYNLPDLVKLVQAEITREHIIAQIPSFQVTAHGFMDDEDFRLHENLLGNLTPLTRVENSRCQNVAVHTKMTDPSLYAASVFAETRGLAHQYITSGGPFNKSNILARTNSLAAFALSRWAIW